MLGNGAARHTQQLYWPSDIVDLTTKPVTANRLYFMRGPNFGRLDTPLDSLYIRVVGTRRRSYKEVLSCVFGAIFNKTSTMQLVAAKANFVQKAGRDSRRIGIDL